MNWISAQIPMWDSDCDSFAGAGLIFEVRDIGSPEQETFVEDFARAKGLVLEKRGTTIVVRPKPKQSN